MNRVSGISSHMSQFLPRVAFEAKVREQKSRTACAWIQQLGLGHRQAQRNRHRIDQQQLVLAMVAALPDRTGHFAQALRLSQLAVQHSYPLILPRSRKPPHISRSPGRTRTVFAQSNTSCDSSDAARSRSPTTPLVAPGTILESERATLSGRQQGFASSEAMSQRNPRHQATHAGVNARTFAPVLGLVLLSTDTCCFPLPTVPAEFGASGEDFLPFSLPLYAFSFHRPTVFPFCVLIF